MEQWLKLLLLVSELSLVFSSVIAIKLDEDDKETNQIASIIENDELQKLKNVTDSQIGFLNSTVYDAYNKQQRVNNEIRRDAQAQTDKAAFLNSTFRNTYNAQQAQIFARFSRFFRGLQKLFDEFFAQSNYITYVYM